MHSAIAIISKDVSKLFSCRLRSPDQESIIVAPDVYMADFGVSGFVEEVGEGIQSLQTRYSKGMQQYAVLLQTTCAKIPDSLALESAVTIPDNFVTSYFTLFDRLGLPTPHFPVPSPPPGADKPILIYGGGATTGQYAIQLLNFAGYTNVITTASSHHHTYLRSLGADHTIDYKDPDMTEQIIRAAGGKLERVMDCVSAEGTLKIVAQVVAPQATVSMLLPIKAGDSLMADELWMELPADRNPFEKTVEVVTVRTFLYQQNEYLKEKLMPEILPHLLESGVITPNKVRLFDQGTFLERTLAALQLVRSGKVSGEKVVVKVE
ncbi:hypothetical protein BU15DRAFT_85354 [Melanogaster broomeanus]|nr:hypothetical protein BU15DRAFT_85354 [Melanogaster broomeanus]